MDPRANWPLVLRIYREILLGYFHTNKHIYSLATIGAPFSIIGVTLCLPCRDPVIFDRQTPLLQLPRRVLERRRIRGVTYSSVIVFSRVVFTVT